MFIIIRNKYTLLYKMTYLDNNELLSKEILPEVNSIISEYIDSEFSYIENEDDLKDLENKEVDEDLYEEVERGLNNLIDEVKDEYNLSDIDERFNKEELLEIIESAFEDYKELTIEKYLEEFDRIESFNDYFSNEED